MADFVKKTWSCGDTITADDLNRMEDGIAEKSGGGTEPLIVRFTGETETVEDPNLGDMVYNLVDVPTQDVFTALQNGRCVQLFEEINGYRFASGYSLDESDGFVAIGGEPELRVLPSGRLGKLKEES